MSYAHDYDYTPDPKPFAGFLRRGETLVWKGQPDTAVYSASAFRARLLFALSLILFVGTLRLGPKYAPHVGLTVASACALIAFRRVLVAQRAKRVQYGVTEDRLMVCVTGRRAQFFAYELRTMPIQHIEQWGGTSTYGEERAPHGNIRFRASAIDPLWDRLALPDPIAHARNPAFVVVPAPDYVYRIVEDAFTRQPQGGDHAVDVLFEMPEDFEVNG